MCTRGSRDGSTPGGVIVAAAAACLSAVLAQPQAVATVAGMASVEHVAHSNNTSFWPDRRPDTSDDTWMAGWSRISMHSNNTFLHSNNTHRVLDRAVLMPGGPAPATMPPVTPDVGRASLANMLVGDLLPQEDPAASGTLAAPMAIVPGPGALGLLALACGLLPGRSRRRRAMRFR